MASVAFSPVWYPKKFELFALVAPQPAIKPKKFELLAPVAFLPASVPKNIESAVLKLDVAGFVEYMVDPKTDTGPPAIPVNPDPSPEKDPVIPPVTTVDPDTSNDPVTCTCDPAANTRFDLVAVFTPLPIIKALLTDDV